MQEKKLLTNYEQVEINSQSISYTALKFLDDAQFLIKQHFLQFTDNTFNKLTY